MNNYYKVLLGIENGASTTRQRLSLNVPADNRLSAAIVAEKCGDQYVNDPTGATYTHALSVKRLPSPRPSFMSAMRSPKPTRAMSAA